jgi:hypothetical protein
MTILSPARRVASFDELERAGDYTGPHPVEYPEGDRQQVWFLLPVHQGADKYDHTRDGDGVHGVSSPPWEFRASIGCGQPFYWHGYLDEGNIWRQV